MSLYLLRGLPLGFFPSSSPLKNFLCCPALSCLVICSSTSPVFSLLHLEYPPGQPQLCIHIPHPVYSASPSILCNTLICVSWTLGSCCFDRFHTSHPYTSVGNMVAFMTFNLFFLLSPLLRSTASPIPPIILTTLTLPVTHAMPPSYSQPSLLLQLSASRLNTT